MKAKSNRLPPKVYECGICGGYHPWDWNGDCRDNANRFDSPESFAEKYGYSIHDIEVMSMDERVEADSR